MATNANTTRYHAQIFVLCQVSNLSGAQAFAREKKNRSVVESGVNVWLALMIFRLELPRSVLHLINIFVHQTASVRYADLSKINHSS